MPKKAKKEKEGTLTEIIDLDDVAGEDVENVNAAFGACIHGVLDDNDCLECRSNSCMGGPDCECKARSRR